MLVVGTTAVHQDEPCVSLKEEILPAPDFKGKHRYQIIRVLRRDKCENPVIAEIRRDMGDASNYKVYPFVIPGCGPDNIPVHNVGELMEIADEMRSEKMRPPDRAYPNFLKEYERLKGRVPNKPLR